MYNNKNCKILHQRFDKVYVNLFTQMYIQLLYGDELVLGDTLVGDEVE